MNSMQECLTYLRTANDVVSDITNVLLAGSSRVDEGVGFSASNVLTGDSDYCRESNTHAASMTEETCLLKNDCLRGDNPVFKELTSNAHLLKNSLQNMNLIDRKDSHLSNKYHSIQNGVETTCASGMINNLLDISTKNNYNNKEDLFHNDINYNASRRKRRSSSSPSLKRKGCMMVIKPLKDDSTISSYINQFGDTTEQPYNGLSSPIYTENQVTNIGSKRVNTNASKPRHVPAFCGVWSKELHTYFSGLCDNTNDLSLILRFYKLGIIGLKRVQKDDDHVEGFIADVCKRSTRLTIDKPDLTIPTAKKSTTKVEDESIDISNNDNIGYCSLLNQQNVEGNQSNINHTLFTQIKKEHWTASIGFTNRSKRWTLCPSRICCSSAVDRDKIVGQWKILQLNSTGNGLIIPAAIRASYDCIMDDSDYFLCTLCPQQTYHAKHVPQGSETVFDKHWHYAGRYRYPQDVLVFTDDDLVTRIVWVLQPTTLDYTDDGYTIYNDAENNEKRQKIKKNHEKPLTDKNVYPVNKYNGDAQTAEHKLLDLMIKVMVRIRRENGIVGNTETLSKMKTDTQDPAVRELHSRIFRLKTA